jgi:hypothetical protein
MLCSSGGEPKIYQCWTIQTHGIPKERDWTKCNLHHEDDSVCGILREYYIAFVKTIVCLKLDTILEGFWLSNNWMFKYAKTKLLSTMQVVDWEDPIMHPYCGLKNLKPAPAYTSFKDLNNDFFFSCEVAWSSPCFYVDGKNTKWYY